MKKILVFLTLVTTVFGAWQSGFRIRFGIGLGIGTDFYYDIPRTIADAQAQNWTLTDRPVGPFPQLVLYCLEEKIVCILYDDTGYVAGLQVAMPQDEFTDAPLDWKTQGYTEWTPTVSDGETVKTYWAIQQYLVSEETFKRSKEERLASRDNTKTLQEDGVWVTGFNGELIKIPNNTEDIANNAFTKQSCIPGMGRHYYYNTTTDSTCDSDAMLPWFGMVHSGELVATGFVTFGTLPVKDNQRNWFERAPALASRIILPNAPSCLYDLASSPGRITMHIYYIEKPWFLGCLFQ